MKSHLKKFQARPLSWSSISSFNYDRAAWARKYLEGVIEPPNAKMTAGKRIEELWATIPSFLPVAPRYRIFQKELKFKIGKIPIIGYIDSFQEDPLAFIELKTYQKDERWTQKTSDNHGQIALYKIGLWLLYDELPENIGSHLVAVKVKESGDFKIELCKTTPIKIFEVKHTKIQLLNFLIEVKKTYAEMEKFSKEFNS